MTPNESVLEAQRQTASHADAATEDSESAIWAQFVAPGSLGQFHQCWLAILCSQIDGVLGALLLTRADDQNTYVPAAIWPDVARDMSHLAPTAQRALAERRGIVERVAGEGSPRPAGAQVAYPVEVGNSLYGAIVLELRPRQDGELQHDLRLLHWGTAWLVEQARQRDCESLQATIDRLGIATELIATATQEKAFRASALAVANEISRRLACERVALGADRKGVCRVLAISHTAMFDAKSVLTRTLADAMDEVLDLGAPVVYPAASDDALHGSAHATLAKQAGVVAILSVPLSARGRDWGVLTLERTGGKPFDPSEIELSRTLGLLLGPVLEIKRDNDRNVFRRTWDGIAEGVRALFGPRHPGWKLIGALVLLIVVFLSLADGEHRVSARTVIEGEVQRAAVAPFEGYIAESPARAGDLVQAGQLLARLDDKDLRLERTKWEAEREQHMRKYRQALAAHDRSNMNVLAAQINQAEAQLQLVNEKLARAHISAPFDGVVVSGDLSQLLGTPIELGKTLFEIAPLDAYRVILKVDERDIGFVRTQQRGELALAGVPGVRLPFSIVRITPTTTPEEGRNYFRVEAKLDAETQRLRPGMEGVGKVSIGERRLIWIWTHQFVDWLRLAFWTWMP